MKSRVENKKNQSLYLSNNHIALRWIITKLSNRSQDSHRMRWWRWEEHPLKCRKWPPHKLTQTPSLKNTNSHLTLKVWCEGAVKTSNNTSILFKQYFYLLSYIMQFASCIIYSYKILCYFILFCVLSSFPSIWCWRCERAYTECPYLPPLFLTLSFSYLLFYFLTFLQP